VSLRVAGVFVHRKEGRIVDYLYVEGPRVFMSLPREDEGRTWKVN
jgi:hypothetical protein